MSVPKRRKTSSYVRRGRAHHALKTTNLSPCGACGAPSMPHRACPDCGAYGKRKQAVDTSRTAERAIKKAQLRAARMTEAAAETAETKPSEVAEEPAKKTSDA